MQLLQPRAPLVDSSVDRSSDCQRSADHRADPCEEAGEALRSGFAVDDLHRADVVAEEDAWDAAVRM